MPLLAYLGVLAFLFFLYMVYECFHQNKPLSMKATPQIESDATRAAASSLLFGSALNCASSDGDIL
jgi:hypothetical protein